MLIHRIFHGNCIGEEMMNRLSKIQDMEAWLGIEAVEEPMHLKSDGVSVG